MLILNADKVACFDALLEVLILKELALHRNCAKRGGQESTVVGLRGTASRGISGRQAEGACRLNETIITYLGNLSIVTYKWFRCCGIAASKAETGKVKVNYWGGREDQLNVQGVVRAPGLKVRNVLPSCGKLSPCDSGPDPAESKS